MVNLSLLQADIGLVDLTTHALHPVLLSKQMCPSPIGNYQTFPFILKISKHAPLNISPITTLGFFFYLVPSHLMLNKTGCWVWLVFLLVFFSRSNGCSQRVAKIVLFFADWSNLCSSFHRTADTLFFRATFISTSPLIYAWGKGKNCLIFFINWHMV